MIFDALVVAKLSRSARCRDQGVDPHRLLRIESDERRAKVVKERTTSAESSKTREAGEKKGERHPPRDMDKYANARSSVPLETMKRRRGHPRNFGARRDDIDNSRR